MTDIILPVSKEWRDRAFIGAAKYDEMYARSIADPEGFWRDQAARLDWIKPFTKVKNVSWDPDNLFIKWFEDGTLNVTSNCIDRHLPAQRAAPRSSGKATIPASPRPSPIDNCTTKSAASPMCCAGRRQERRPRHHLSADDPRSGLRDAGLRAHRRGAFGGVRRLFARQSGGPHPRLRLDGRYHRR